MEFWANFVNKFNTAFVEGNRWKLYLQGLGYTVELTVIALIIGGAGMAIPEMSMLLSIFKARIVAAIVALIFLTAVIGGYLFEFILS